MLLPKVKRRRSKSHLIFVRQQPCLIGGLPCGPCQAHHLTHVQPKARGLKAGDNYTVPLCDKHHRELHAYGDESLFWALKGIAPIPAARELWRQTKARLSKPPSHGG